MVKNTSTIADNMATAEHVKELLKSHTEQDDARFYSIVLQVAATEARQDHHKLAKELKALVERYQKISKSCDIEQGTHKLKENQDSELKDILNFKSVSVRKNELVIAEDTRTRLDLVLLEQRQKDKLSQYGLLPRRKLLFTGPPGTGKTMASAVLATALRMPLYTVILDSVINCHKVEKSAKLHLIFDHIQQEKAVYLFDDLDAIGTYRGIPNDVREIRRSLNSFLIFVEKDFSQSVIIATTNHPELLDKSLCRRFDDIIRFENPSNKELKQIVENHSYKFDVDRLAWDKILSTANGLSAEEVTRACAEAAKEMVLNNSRINFSSQLIKSIERYQSRDKQSQLL